MLQGCGDLLPMPLRYTFLIGSRVCGLRGKHGAEVENLKYGGDSKGNEAQGNEEEGGGARRALEWRGGGD